MSVPSAGLVPTSISYMFSTSWKLVASAARAGLSVWKSELLGTTICPPWTGGSISPYASLIACLASSLVRDWVPGSVPTPIPPAAGVASWAPPRRGKRAADKPRAPARSETWLRPLDHGEEYHRPGAEAFNEPALHCQTRGCQP